jgi:hypothetical protein
MIGALRKFLNVLLICFGYLLRLHLELLLGYDDWTLGLRSCLMQGEAPPISQLGESHLQLEQLQELERKVEEDHLQLAQLHATIEGEHGNRDVGAACLRARDV